MNKIEIKPLSVNQSWKGRRFRTDLYNDYEEEMFIILPKTIEFHTCLEIEFGFSSKASDIDNPLKPLLDILQKKYEFNDKEIERLIVNKKYVKKGEEYIKFEFKEI